MSRRTKKLLAGGLFPAALAALAFGCGESPADPTGKAVEEKNSVSYTNVFEAAQAGNVEGVLSFFNTGASPTNRQPETGHTILHMAAWSGDTNLVKLVLGSDVDINALDDDGQSPLDFTWRPNSQAVRNLLISKGAKPGVELRPPPPAAPPPPKPPTTKTNSPPDVAPSIP